MKDVTEFDQLYAGIRTPLLHQLIALTGDPVAAREGVIEGLSRLWQRWDKVTSEAEAEAWVRPVAWRYAKRRHRARMLLRPTRINDQEALEALEALDKLNWNERRVLIHRELTSTTHAEAGEELGINAERIGIIHTDARNEFSKARYGVEREVLYPLDPLWPLAKHAQWPPAEEVRGSGAFRRTWHTAVGTAAIVVLTLLAGFLVTRGETVPASLANEEILTVNKVDSAQPKPKLHASSLLRAPQVKRVDKSRSWRGTRVQDNTRGDGLVVPCQRARFADPDGQSTMLRKFTGTPRKKSKDKIRFVETAELSMSEESAAEAYDRAVEWYGICTENRSQLIDSMSVDGVGDAAQMFVVRSWVDPVMTYTIGVARSGQHLVTVARKAPGDVKAKDVKVGRLLAAAVNGFCGTPGAGTCAAPPDPEPEDPLPAAEPAQFLAEIDLPPIPDVEHPWAGTEAETPKVNTASSGCDKTEFKTKSIAKPQSRTFLIPDAKLPEAFGLSQTTAVAKSERAAKKFVAGVRERMSNCEEDNLGADVEEVKVENSKGAELTVWRIQQEINEDESITFLMSIIRAGRVISQVGFLPDSGKDVTNEEFVALSERAQVRLDQARPSRQ